MYVVGRALYIYFFHDGVFVDGNGAVGDRLCVAVLHGLTRFDGVIILSVLSEVEDVLFSRRVGE